MIPNSFSRFVANAAPMIANHMWQSTLFAAAIGVLMLVLRKSQARVRYGLWLTASVKFLIPFSLLIGLGQLAASSGSVRVQTGFYSAVEEASQPFTRFASQAVAPVARTGRAANQLPFLGAVLAVLWLCGFLTMLGQWWVRWRRASGAMREAVSAARGREVDALRRMERMAGVRKPIAFLVSRDPVEPGIFGIVRPVLLWPAEISKHLRDAHLEAILAHEVWHVRRRDNLAATIHMLVEAIFWFHPLVWWLGARLIEERELACDEEVLRLGSEPRVYAESLLTTGEFCVGSPLPCVSGVTGSNLKERIVRIMTQQSANKLTLGRKLLLASIGIAAVAGPVVIGLLNAPKVQAQSPPPQLVQMTAAPLPSVEVVSLKPNLSGDKRMYFSPAPAGFRATNVTVRQLIEFAYGVKDYQLTGGPSWIDSQRYDIDLKPESPPAAPAGKLAPVALNQNPLMVQSVLADRFNLKLSHETKELAVDALVVANNSPKIIPERDQTLATPSNPQAGQEPIIRVRTLVRKGAMTVRGPVGAFTDVLTGVLGQPVVDKTGLKGSYDVLLSWTPGPDQKDSIAAALQDQLGLKLEPRQAPVQMLVIDDVQTPSPS